MTIKAIDRKIVSSPGGFKTMKIKYIDTKSGRTWWTEGDLSKKGKNDELKIAKNKSKSESA